MVGRRGDDTIVCAWVPPHAVHGVTQERYLTNADGENSARTSLVCDAADKRVG